jgi:predicted RNA polymerase sigma factor
MRPGIGSVSSNCWAIAKPARVYRQCVAEDALGKAAAALAGRWPRTVIPATCRRWTIRTRSEIRGALKRGPDQGA